MKKNNCIRQQSMILPIMAVLLVFIFFSSASAQQNHKKGDRVEVRTGGTWYKATVIDVADGKYKVHYDGYTDSSDEWVKAYQEIRISEGRNITDGQNTTSSREQESRKPKSIHNKALPKFTPGDRVEADISGTGQYYKGTVMPYQEGDFGRTTGETIRVRFDHQTRLYQDGLSINVSQVRKLDEKRPAISDTKYKVGEQVEVLFTNAGDTWEPAKILEEKDGFYKISYMNNEVRWVDQTMIRRLGNVKKTAAENITTKNLSPMKIPGTAWSVKLYNKGETPPDRAGKSATRLQFCESGTLYLNPGGKGTYKVAGNQLTMRFGTDASETYRIIKGNDYIDLDSGSGLMMRLYDGVEYACN